MATEDMVQFSLRNFAVALGTSAVGEPSHLFEGIW